MNAKVSKRIRKLFDLDNKVSRDAYKIVKKNYNRLPQKHREDFLKALESQFNSD